MFLILNSKCSGRLQGKLLGAHEPIMNILLIDDDENLLKLLARPLKKYGHFISEANNGSQGWELFQENPHRFDILVTDLNMPVLGGVELLKRLREKEYDIPVIVISGCEDIQSVIEVLRLGAFDFLVKPFKATELLELLDKLETVQENQKRQLQNLPFFTEHIDISIHSHTQFIPSVGAFLQDRVKLFCKMHRIDIRNIGLCLHEALVNAIVHGNLEIPSVLKNEEPEQFEKLLQEREASSQYTNRHVTIRCQVTTKQLKFEIEDEGKGFNPQQIQFTNPTMMIPTGRGILIISAFMDEVSWNKNGNCITMIKHLQTVSQNDVSEKTPK